MAILTVSIGATRKRLLALSEEIERACDKEGLIDLTVYCKHNGLAFEEVQLVFSNDDIEGRDDLDPDAILVDTTTY